ncbi:hypothetical protein TNCV_3055641 [Trichonephila clavipes]|nr:hypothetical protein TNCV_3055641 [Trichonephila clavipes]
MHSQHAADTVMRLSANTMSYTIAILFLFVGMERCPLRPSSSILFLITEYAIPTTNHLTKHDLFTIRGLQSFMLMKVILVFVPTPAIW